MAAYRYRLLAGILKRASRGASVVMLTGARQVGKTTLLRRLDPARRWVTLDDADLRRLAQEDPKQFLERFPPPVFIDEFQYAPQILPLIKIAVDEKRTRLKPASGMFWLSGSQNFLLMEGVQESLAGRVAIFRLAGFSLAEARGRAEKAPPKPFFERPGTAASGNGGLKELFRLILRGDKPETWVRPAVDRERFYSSYLQTYLERDVRSQLGVKQLGLFDRFLRGLAARVGQLLNMSSLASELGISVPTVREWLTVLERSEQVLLLPPYWRNPTKRLVKAPKVYFWDTGLAAHLLKWSDPEVALAGPMAGSLFENWAVSEIAKSHLHRGQEPNLYFWRSREGREFDLVREAPGGLDVAEIKLGSAATALAERLVHSVRALGSPPASLRLVCMAPEGYTYKGVQIVSAWDLA